MPPFSDRFTAKELDPAHWVVTRSEPFSGSTIDLINRTPSERWLRLRLDNSKSPNHKMKLHGVRTRNAVVNFDHPTEINFTLDWNTPPRSHGMAAGIYLCSDSKSEAPGIDFPDYIKVMYYGDAGMGSQAHLEVAICNACKVHLIYDEGYHAHMDDRTGKVKYQQHTIGVQQIRLVVDKNGMTVWENNNQVCHCVFNTVDGLVAPLTWSTGYLYLQQECTHSFPAHELFFTNIHVRQLPETTNVGGSPQPN